MAEQWTIADTLKRTYTLYFAVVPIALGAYALRSDWNAWVMIVIVCAIVTVGLAIWSIAQATRAHNRDLRDKLLELANAHDSQLAKIERAGADAVVAAKAEGMRIGAAERDSALSDVLRVEAYCDPARGHGMFYSNKGIVIRFGIRVTNAGQRVVRPTEAGNMQLIPRWNTQVALSSSEKPKRLRETQSIGHQESTDIGDFEFVAGQWNWVSPPPGGVFAMFEVSGTLLIDARSGDDETMTFRCDNLALPVTGSPESPCQLPDAALARVADVPIGSKLRVAPESGNQSAVESEAESEAEKEAGAKQGSRRT